MTKAQAAKLDGACESITRLTTVLLGANGDIGFVAETRESVRGIKEVMPELTTKAECKEAREGCVVRKEKRWTRSTQIALGIFSGIGACSALVAIVLGVLKLAGKI